MKKAKKQNKPVLKVQKVALSKAKAKPAIKTLEQAMIPDIPDCNYYTEIEYLVKCWGCDPAEAEAASYSKHLAFVKQIWLPLIGGSFLKDVASTERALIAMLGDDLAELMKELLSSPELAQRIKADPAGFAVRLNNFYETKKTGVRHLKSYPKWKAFLLIGWSKFRKWPPLCLWTDGALCSLLPQMPSEETVRRFISRAGLVRPRAPRFGIDQIRIDGRRVVKFTKRTGGTFGQKAKP